MSDNPNPIIYALSVGPLATNCYLVGCPETRKGVVIDPGGNADQILKAVEENDLKICYVLNTHCHFDHIEGNSRLMEETGAPLAIHHLELPILQSRGGADWFGMLGEKSPSPTVDLADTRTLEVGTLEMEVLHTPGHSPGSVTFYLPAGKAAFVGDLLFNNGVGRTDLPGGDWDTLLRSINEVIFSLPDDTAVYPGHGPATTIAAEKTSNPYLRPLHL